MGTLPTIKIKAPTTKHGYVTINESDFVEGEHEIYSSDEDANSEPSGAAPDAETPAAPEYSRSDIATMKREDLEMALLKREASVEGNVPDLKERLSGLVFAEI